MKSGDVVMDPPAFDQRFVFTQIIEDLLGPNFISLLSVEAFAVPTLPSRSRLNVQGLDA